MERKVLLTIPQELTDLISVNALLGSTPFSMKMKTWLNALIARKLTSTVLPARHETNAISAELRIKS